MTMPEADLQGVQQQGIQPSVLESSGSTPRGTAGPSQAERGVTANSVSGHSPSVTALVTTDRSAIVVRAANGQSLELPMEAWRDAVALIDAILAGGQSVAKSGAASFGPAPGRVGPGRHGADWSAHETLLLNKGFRAGSSIAALALTHQRTTGAVENQLVKAGLLRPGERQFGSPRLRTSQGANFGEPE
jgi:hypothetical protein